MGIELRMPNITGNEQEQLVQIRSYLYQIIPQLQWALNNVGTTGVNNAQGAAPQATKNATPSSFTPVSAETTFAKLKPLIIKSADIVEAYYEEINRRLEGIYVAESDFGTFVEKTEQTIESNSRYMEQEFSNVQVIMTDVVEVKNSIDQTNFKVEEATGAIEHLQNTASETAEKVEVIYLDIEAVNKAIEGLKTSIVEANAHIRSGFLYYDGDRPVFGLEVGQRDVVDGVEVFRKYARFIADRLSFYDQNDTEVAYISDNRLFICNVEITSGFKIGGFQDTVMADGGVVTKWVGGVS